jgi:beta-phosphoglucomutase-like phosphatase (HAD superfamily)
LKARAGGPARSQPPFDLVIFDNDGVLVDSEWHANRFLADLLSEAGLPSTREGCIAEYMGSTMARVREIAERRLGRPLPGDLARGESPSNRKGGRPWTMTSS